MAKPCRLERGSSRVQVVQRPDEIDQDEGSGGEVEARHIAGMIREILLLR